MPNYSVTATNNSDTAWQAFDKNLATGWENTSSSGNIRFMFNAPTLVKGFRFVPPIDETKFPTKIDIHGRNSSGATTAIKIFTTSTPAAGVPQDCVLESAVKYDGYVFVLHTPYGNSGNPAVADIEFLVYRNSISPAPKLQEKIVIPSTNKQSVTPDSNYDGLSKVDVNAIPDSYTDTSDAAVSASDILSGKTAYGSSGKVTGTMSTVDVPTPTININSTGLITASNTQTAGYSVGGTKSATSQLTRKTAETFTPTTTNQTIASGQYLTGVQTIKGDSNLKAANIKSGVSIFGVNGSYTGDGVNTSDATAIAKDIIYGKTAYVNGSKVTGTLMALANTMIIKVTNNTSNSISFYGGSATGNWPGSSDRVTMSVPAGSTQSMTMLPGVLAIYGVTTGSTVKVRSAEEITTLEKSMYFYVPRSAGGMYQLSNTKWYTFDNVSYDNNNGRTYIRDFAIAYGPVDKEVTLHLEFANA